MTGVTSDPAITDLAGTARLLVALDFDGTLTPLADDPMSVRAIPEAKHALANLASLPNTTVALVSGRGMAGLRIIAEHTDDSPLWLAGSHGVEYWLPGEGISEFHEESEAPDDPDELTRQARALISGLDGVWIESKDFGFALHTRLSTATDSAVAQERIEDFVRENAAGWRRREGRDVREYAWRHEGKDSALRHLRELTQATAVLFAGDDVTDEDAQRALLPGDLGVRVGDGESIAARRVADPPALAALLASLAEVRAARQT